MPSREPIHTLLNAYENNQAKLEETINSLAERFESDYVQEHLDTSVVDHTTNEVVARVGPLKVFYRGTYYPGTESDPGRAFVQYGHYRSEEGEEEKVIDGELSAPLPFKEGDKDKELLSSLSRVVTRIREEESLICGGVAVPRSG